LSALGNYVEDVANDALNAAIGPIAIILSAGMRPQDESVHPIHTALVVKPGTMFQTLFCTAASNHGIGSHEWGYRQTSGPPDVWTSVNPTTAAKTTLVALTRGDMISVRHRSVTSHGVSDWEEYEGIIVP
jgi:hypothetical protein